MLARKWYLALTAVLVLIIPGVPFWLQFGPRLDNQPGPITTPMQVLAGNPILGSFTGVRKWRGPGRIGSRGGGCLLYQEAGPGNQQACTSSSDCAQSLLLADGLTEQPVFPYCEPESLSSIGKSCWYKPVDDSQHCKKGLRFWQATTELGEVDAYPLGETRAMRWRVQTCQITLQEGYCNVGAGRILYGASTVFPAKP